MTTMGLPFFLEDRTGLLHESDFDEIYDRMFLRVESTSPSHQSHSSPRPPICIYDIGRRSPPVTARRPSLPSISTSSQSRHPQNARAQTSHGTPSTYREPAAVLDFAPGGGLGTILFLQARDQPGGSVSMPMGHYLRRTSAFGRSSSRKFRASDGYEYKWTFRSLGDHEWACINARNELVAHYDLKPPGEPAYKTSGNVLTIYEPFVHLAVEILSSLLIMRYITQHNL